MFVVTTPGVLVQPWHVAAWVRFNLDHYGTVGHFGHTIRNHWAHAWAMAEYLTLVLPSHYMAASVVVSAMAVVGAAVLVRRDWRAAAVVVPFVVLYVGYFAQQVVMLVRNLLVLAPALAVLSAVGWAAVGRAARSRGDWRPGCAPAAKWRAARSGGDGPSAHTTAGVTRAAQSSGDSPRPHASAAVTRTSRGVGTRLRLFAPAAVGIALAAVVVIGGRWQWRAAGDMSIRRSRAWQAAAAGDYLKRHPAWRVWPSDGVAAAVGLPTVPADAGTRDVVATFAQEDGDLWRWPANVPGLTLATFGADACNFDYYPNWMDDRLVVMDLAAARRVPVGQVERAVRRHDLAGAGHGPLLAYLNGGGTAAVADHGVTIRAVAGTPYPCNGDVAVPQPDNLTIQADNHAVAFEIEGLDPGRRYELGWSWWDWNGGHRVSSAWVSWGGAVVADGIAPDATRSAALLGPTAVPAWPLATDPVPHPRDWWWPPRPLWTGPVVPPRWAALPAAAITDGRCRDHVPAGGGAGRGGERAVGVPATVTRRRPMPGYVPAGGGPDVVATEVWASRRRRRHSVIAATTTGRAVPDHVPVGGGNGRGGGGGMGVPAMAMTRRRDSAGGQYGGGLCRTDAWPEGGAGRDGHGYVGVPAAAVRRRHSAGAAAPTGRPCRITFRRAAGPNGVVTGV